ncbi:hypothetical protein CTheo_9178 [Ceratobasidium theobromae]|uniref:Uncharacterized protein n=1 Tax=Ceratobasidium theobromae TaxID=1582974 RepID=A0A5N5Q7J1_9AGAM|nr:hypothetical protein CTheo_9178 [Ceratobasidium theobromae]
MRRRTQTASSTTVRPGALRAASTGGARRARPGTSAVPPTWSAPPADMRAQDQPRSRQAARTTTSKGPVTPGSQPAASVGDEEGADDAGEEPEQDAGQGTAGCEGAGGPGDDQREGDDRESVPLPGACGEDGGEGAEGEGPGRQDDEGGGERLPACGGGVEGRLHGAGAAVETRPGAST